MSAVRSPGFRRWRVACAVVGLAGPVVALALLVLAPDARTWIELMLLLSIASGAVALLVPATAPQREIDPTPDRLPATEVSALPTGDRGPMITGEQYAEAQRASEAAMLAKDEFLATMSHEIRTPLNGVLPLLELVLSSPLGADQREHISTAYGSAQAMLRIVDDILDYSKLDVGKVSLENIGINLRDLVDNVSRLMRRSAEAKGLRLTATIDSGVRLAVRGDPVRLRQVLMNLVSNAIKFTARGEVGIHVSRRGETADAHDLVFSIRDTGIGMTPEAITHLFKPFSQGDASVTRAFGGTGLGLVICKRLVDLMHGEIGVKSEPGKGSQFWFRVPLAKIAGDLPTRRDVPSRRALACIGDPAAQARMQSLLADLGIVQVDLAPTPAAALAALHDGTLRSVHWQYGLLVVDTETTRGGTEAFVRHVLADPKLTQVRVLVFDGAGRNNVKLADPRVAMLRKAASPAQNRNAIEALMTTSSEPAGDDDVELDTPGISKAYEALRGDILVVEDNIVNRKVAETLLAQYGLDVDTAENGALALGKLRARRFDLVLMDCRMPEMDGYTATRQWRRHELETGERAIPIVAMTAHSMLGDRDKCLDAGMDDYLTKPLSRETLERVLKRWLAFAKTVSNRATTISLVPATIVGCGGAPVRAGSAAGVPMVDANILDECVLAELRDVIGAQTSPLASLFIAESRAHLADIESALERADAAAIIAATHSLKSSSANFGAVQFASLAKHIEESLRESAYADVTAQVRRLRPSLEDFVVQLESALARRLEGGR